MPDQLPSLFSDLWYDTIAIQVELEGTENLFLKFQQRTDEMKNQTAQAPCKPKIELLTARFIRWLSEWTAGFAVDQLEPNKQLEFNHNAAHD